MFKFKQREEQMLRELTFKTEVTVFTFFARFCVILKRVIITSQSGYAHVHAVHMLSLIKVTTVSLRSTCSVRS